MRRFTQGFYGYAVALFVCLAGAGLFLLVTPQSREEHIPRLDYSITVANFGHAVPYGVWAPQADPANWVPNSNRIADGENGAKVLYLGYATAARQHAMFVQSDERPAAGFASRMANTDKAMRHPAGRGRRVGAALQGGQEPALAGTCAARRDARHHRDGGLDGAGRAGGPPPATAPGLNLSSDDPRIEPLQRRPEG